MTISVMKVQKLWLAGLGMPLVISWLGLLVLAVYNLEERNFVPYVSELGASSSESRIFHVLITGAATLSALGFILRYMIIKQNNTSTDVCKINTFTLFCGIVAMTGMIIVGQYSATESGNLVVHCIGAFLAVSALLLYIYGQTWISYRMAFKFQNRSIFRMRLCITCATTICLMLLALGNIFVAMNEFHLHTFDENFVSFMRPSKDEGFELLTICAAAEWLIFFLFAFYQLTYVGEFLTVDVNIDLKLLFFHCNKKFSKAE